MGRAKYGSIADLLVGAAVAAGVAVAEPGCANLPPCPARGGPGWNELTSEHFTVRTDLDDAAAYEVVWQLEETRAAMLGAVWPGAPGPPDRVQVIALASTSELSEFIGQRVDGIWVHQPPFPATMVTGGYFESDRQVVLRHELAHHLSRWFLPQQPTWFSEGIATFLETIRYDREHQRAVVGEPAVARYRSLRARGLYPTRRLLTEVHPDVADLGQFESTTWLLVHYLVNQRGPAFESFQRRLGAFEQPQDAWPAVFGDLDAERLRSTLDLYAATGEYTVIHVGVPTPSGRMQKRPMTDAEVHAARAFMYTVGTQLGASDGVGHARAEVDEALNADAAGPIEALTVQYFFQLGEGQSAQRKALAERASRAHPRSALAWLMMADAAELGDAHRTALTRALGLAPHDAELLIRMAFLKASAQKWEEAVGFSRKAIRLRTVSPRALSIHVLALAHTGQCREASFFAAGLRGSTTADSTPARVVNAEWPELRATCMRIAADRARQSKDPADGDPVEP